MLSRGERILDLVCPQRSSCAKRLLDLSPIQPIKCLKKLPASGRIYRPIPTISREEGEKVVGFNLRTHVRNREAQKALFPN